ASYLPVATPSTWWSVPARTESDSVVFGLEITTALTLHASESRHTRHRRTAPGTGSRPSRTCASASTPVRKVEDADLGAAGRGPYPRRHLLRFTSAFARLQAPCYSPENHGNSRRRRAADRVAGAAAPE